MAERRMFAKTIVLSDAFLDMPASSRCLYFTLGMFADDDGFINNPKSIMRQTGASNDDMNLLLAKKFLISFDDGVIVIKHWRIHNYIQRDRYKPTKYKDHKDSLNIDNNNAYTLTAPCEVLIEEQKKENVYKMDTQDRLGKDRLGKDSIITKDKIKELILSYEFTDKVIEAITDWLQYKKEKKQTYKPKGLTMLLKRIDATIKSCGEDYIVEAINHSISQNYSGIYPAKGAKENKDGYYTNIDASQYDL